MGDAYTQPIKKVNPREVHGYVIVDTQDGFIWWPTFQLRKSNLYNWAKKQGLKPVARWKIKSATLRLTP